MRILILTQWFAPEPIFKGLPFAKELQRRGHEVEVLTGIPNYPDGKIYKGYKIRLFQREYLEGIPVIRVPLYISHDSSAIKRVLNYGSFAVSAAFLGVAMVKPADVMYVYHPPATIGLPAIAISMIRKIPIVYDIQDLWPDTLSATGMLNNKKALSLVDSWCKFVYRKAARIVVLSPGFKEKLVERGVPEEKIEVIYNWSEEDQKTLTSEDSEISKVFGDGEKFNVLFAGTMGKAHALDAVLDAAKLLATEYSNIQFVFIGGGVDEGRLKVRAEKFSNVKFLPRRPMTEIGRVLAAADVLLVHLKNDPLFKITIPSKTQAYLAAGKPILMGVEGDAADLVQMIKAGATCLPENAESIADAVINLYSLPPEQRAAMGTRGKEFYYRELSLKAGADRFERVFNEVVRGPVNADKKVALTIRDYSEIADIHINNLDSSFLATLGKRFLALMYRCIDESSNSALFVHKVNDRVSGFITGTVGFGEIYKIMLKRHLFQLIMALLPALVSPKKMARIFEILLYSKKHGSQDDELPSAELLSIAIDKNFRGKKIADELYQDLCVFFQRERISSFKIIVGSALEPAHRFYTRMGAKPVAEIEVHKGEKSVVYIQEILFAKESCSAVGADQPFVAS